MVTDPDIPEIGKRKVAANVACLFGVWAQDEAVACDPHTASVATDEELAI